MKRTLFVYAIAASVSLLLIAAPTQAQTPPMTPALAVLGSVRY